MPGMKTLADRMQELMTTTGWEHADLVRISGQSSSTVSQWRGSHARNRKPVEEIRCVSAAVRLAERSNFNAVWLAEGTGPKFRELPPPSAATTFQVREPDAQEIDFVLAALQRMLASVPSERRPAVAANLSGWAADGGTDNWLPAIRALLTAPAAEKRAA
jgi:hypothetical protein